MSRIMKPSFGWRGCRYAKDGYIMLSRLEGMSLPSSCKHCRNQRLGRCLQEANRHIPVLHPKRCTFLREWLRKHESLSLAWRCPLVRSGLGYQWLGCESECCRPEKSSNEQMTRSDYLGNNRNEKCHRLIGHVRFSRRCTLHCGCSLFL